MAHSQILLQKIKIDYISGSTVWNVIRFVLIVYLSRGLPKYIETKVLTTCFYIIKSFFKKIKRELKLVSLPHFLHDFWRKIFLTLHFINLTNFIDWLPLLLKILGNICTVIICCPVCDVINFEINHSLINLISLILIGPFFYVTKNSGQKCKYLKNE